MSVPITEIIASALTLPIPGTSSIPMAVGFIVCDVFVAVGWIGMVVKDMLPVRKIALICNPLIVALFGQLMNLIAEGLDSGFESFGWLLLYLVCAMKLVGKEERI